MLASVDGDNVACMQPPSGSTAATKIAIDGLDSFGTAGPR
jgi:hypothetical protein